MLPSLGHGAISGGNYQNRSIHLGGSGDHVLDIVGMSRAVHVGIVPVVGLILHMRDSDGNPALSFFRGLIDLTVIGSAGKPLLAQNLGDR
jgi:hypothetical protein